MVLHSGTCEEEEEEEQIGESWIVKSVNRGNFNNMGRERDLSHNMGESQMLPDGFSGSINGI